MNDQSAQWLKGWIRFGFLVKGLVYILLGFLAAQAALTYRQQAQDARGVLQAIAQQPSGNILLIIIAFGLARYACWRFIEALFDPEACTQGVKRWLKRLGSGLSSLAYGGLALTALQIIQGIRQESESTELWTAKVLALPMGQWLVGLVGAGVIGIGITFFYRTFNAGFRKQLQLGTMDSRQKAAIVTVGRAGYLSRGIVFVIMGRYAIRAAHDFDADKVQSSEKALDTIKQQPYGPGLLTLMAVGLIAYGIHMGLQARYRQIELPANE